jgi:hypothetical protein
MSFIEDDEKRPYSNIGFKKGKQKCLVCGRIEDWKCRVREDELLGLCKFVPNDDGKTDRYGRYIHKINGGTENNSPQTPKDDKNYSAKEENSLSAEYLNAVYTQYLDGLVLEEKHREHLLSRGLSNETIDAKGYKSVPDYSLRYSQITDLITDYDLEGVPGFYLDGNQWCINMTFSGFYIPYRDADGNIVGLQLRPDDDSKPKYMWFSSNERNKGKSSGSPFHFVNPDRVSLFKEVYLTEGALKADIIAAESGFSLIAMAGVVAIAPKQVSKAIYDSFPDIENIVVAFDSDWKTNPNVKSALIRLLDELQDSVVRVSVAVWDESLGKGLDDVFQNERYDEDSVQFVPVEEFLKAENGAGGDEPPPPVEAETDDEENEDFVYSWDKFSKLSFANTDRVIFGLVRGNVGLVIAPTNVGKTTFSLNLALSVTAQREFLPILNKNHSAKRVLYVDGEATKAELQADIVKMLESFDETQRQSVSKNLFLVCDEELNDEPLDLVNPEHTRKIENAALKCNADLIIIDTLAALMDVTDENDNAIIKAEVMKPLKKVAKKANATVLLLHHSGKFNEGAPQGVNRGRGASTIPALCRAVFNLERDESGNNRVSLACSKVKGEIFKKTLLELNPESRWFSVRGISPDEDESNWYKQIIDFVRKAGKVVERAEILSEFEKDSKMSRPTIDRNLNKAVDQRDLEKVGHGKYKCSNTQHTSQELALDE